jgi:PAS domain S-box-containing protein
MLADQLMAHRQEVVRNVVARAPIVGPPVLATGREGRIGALVDELIGTLEHPDERVPTHRRPARATERSVEAQERELVRREVIDEVGRESLTATPAEIMMVCDWACAAERSRQDETCRRLSELLDDINDGVLILSLEGRVEYLNRRAAYQLHEATGLPLDQLGTKTAAELGFDHFPDEQLTLARRKEPIKDSHLGRWNERRYRPIYSPAGEVEAVASLSRDIHGPRLAEIRLDLLSKLNAIVGNVDYEDVAEALARVPIAELADWCVVSLVEERRIVRTFVAQSNPANAALQEAAMRAAPTWARNVLWSEMTLTRGFQLLTDVSDELLRTFALNDEHYRLMAAAGVRSIMVQPVALRREIAAIFTLMYTAESGRRYGQDDPSLTSELALHAAHIIENARLMKDLRASEARFRVSLDGARTVVFEQNGALRYVWYHNPFAGPSLLGKTDEEALLPEDAALLTRLKRRVLEHGESVHRELGVTWGGERRQYREVVEPLRDHAGKIIGVIGSATDISEEKRRQEQLCEALAFREQMMAVLGHDLRNPLNAVTMAATASLKADVPDHVRRNLEVIQQASSRMTELIGTLLDLTRVRTEGMLLLSRSSTELSATAQKVVDEARAAWPARSIECEMRGNLSGSFDSARIEQALSNLIENALQHGDSAQSVKVSIDGTEAEVVLKVKNEGPLIPPDVMPILFEPFARGARSLHGLGLGLFIVNQIAIAHEGSVSVESSAETGTVFTLRLPRAPRARDDA